MVAIIRYETWGDEYYESETGPTLGYDNVRSGFHIMPLEMLDGDFFDPEVYRIVRVVAEIETLGM